MLLDESQKPTAPAPEAPQAQPEPGFSNAGACRGEPAPPAAEPKEAAPLEPGYSNEMAVKGEPAEKRSAPEEPPPPQEPGYSNAKASQAEPERPS